MSGKTGQKPINNFVPEEEEDFAAYVKKRLPEGSGVSVVILADEKVSVVPHGELDSEQVMLLFQAGIGTIMQMLHDMEDRTLN